MRDRGKPGVAGVEVFGQRVQRGTCWTRDDERSEEREVCKCPSVNVVSVVSRWNPANLGAPG